MLRKEVAIPPTSHSTCYVSPSSRPANLFTRMLVQSRLPQTLRRQIYGRKAQYKYARISPQSSSKGSILKVESSTHTFLMTT
jgi:hypothetical protein